MDGSALERRGHRRQRRFASERSLLLAWGVQFHPEALLTQHGDALLANFLALGRAEAASGLAAAPAAPEPSPGDVPPPD